MLLRSGLNGPAKESVTVRSNPHVGVKRHAVFASVLRERIVAKVVAEVGAIARPVAIEPHFPRAFSRKADVITVIRMVRHVDDNNHIVARAAIFPSMESDELVIVIDVVPFTC